MRKPTFEAQKVCGGSKFESLWGGAKNKVHDILPLQYSKGKIGSGYLTLNLEYILIIYYD